MAPLNNDSLCSLYSYILSHRPRKTDQKQRDPHTDIPLYATKWLFNNGRNLLGVIYGLWKGPHV